MQEYVEIFNDTWAIALVILFFGGSIFVHEFGHFIAAKLCGLKVLRFSIGFGPTVFSWVGKDGCKYMISLLPFGGYVALPQLADMGTLEGADGNDEEIKLIKNLPSASCGAKIFVSAAGAFFNILLAIVLATIVWIVGLPQSQQYKTTIVGYAPTYIHDIDGTEVESPAFKAGIQAGDKIISIDGKNVSNFEEIIEAIALGSGRDQNNAPLANIKVERDSKILDLKVSPALIRTNLNTGDAIRMIGVFPAMKMRVGSLISGSPAEKAGIKKADEVIAVDSKTLYSNHQLVEYLNKIPNSQAVTLKIKRNNEILDIKIVPAKIIREKSSCILSIPDDSKFSIKLFDSQKNKTSSIKVLSIKSSQLHPSLIKVGDILYQADGKDISNISQLNTIVNHVSANKPVKLAFIDENYNMTDFVLPKGSISKITPPKEQTMLGYVLENITEVSHPTIIEQFSDSIRKTYGALESLVNPKSDIGINSLAGPVDIGRVIYQLSLTDISLMISFAVLLNINLAILNMLPIPVLDGGHILFAIIAKLRGSPIPASVMGAIQAVFTLLFISLMVYVVYYGFMRWSGDSQYERETKVEAEMSINEIKF